MGRNSTQASTNESSQPIIEHPSVAACSVGRLAGTSARNEIVVDVFGRGSRPARFISSLRRADLADSHNVGREVLLLFEQGDSDRPIIVGLLHDPLEELLSSESSASSSRDSEAPVINRESLTVLGKREIVLQCGRGSITIRKDGKIVIKGTDLITRSSGSHRIKGAHVRIN